MEVVRSRRRGAKELYLILVFYAFSREVAALKRRLKERTQLKSGGLDGFRTIVGGRDIAFVATGIGLRRAREAARRALSAFPEASLVIGTGVAGALSRGLKAGDIVIADRVIRARSDSAHPEHIFPVAEREVEHCEHALASAGLACSTGAILTSGRVLADGPAKRLAKEQSGAIAVDMESAAIVFEATSRGVPFAVVRTIMDAADEEVLGPEIADQKGRIRPLTVAAYLASNPRAIAKIPALVRNLARATKSLASAMEALAQSPPPED
jgi:adenosylhomocysteine nucleosidase